MKSFQFIYFFACMLLNFSCSSQESSNKNEGKQFFNDLQSFPDSLVSHFPKKLEESKSFYSVEYPASASYTQYFGVQFVTHISSETEKEELKRKYIDKSYKVDDTLTTNIILPLPNINNFYQDNKKRMIFSISPKMNDYDYYILKNGNKEIFLEQKEIELNEPNKHGYSCGIAISKETQIVYYWSLFW